tara:strand:- start:5589 stop:5729 length:141 start_codon:yes stop_codon:yes gene_type:complete
VLAKKNHIFLLSDLTALYRAIVPFKLTAIDLFLFLLTKFVGTIAAK